MAKRVSEFGKRWDVRTPRSSITYYVNKLHVGTAETEIEAEIRKRCATCKGMLPHIEEQSVAYALIVHRKNGDLYRRVMRGM